MDVLDPVSKAIGIALLFIVGISVLTWIFNALGTRSPKSTTAPHPTSYKESQTPGGVAATYIIAFALLAIFAGEVYRSAPLLQHGFAYVNSDPNIQLRSAQQSSQGHYGIDAIIIASPKTSILWPFLLAPLSSPPIIQWAPLAICFICVVAMTVVAQKLFDPLRANFVYTALLILITNSIALAFTGTEHSLQVLLAVLCAAGAVRERQSGDAVPWFILALILGPLVQYENLAISVPIFIYLFIRGHRLIATAATVICLGVVILFSLYLHGLGLGYLPSSVALHGTLPGEAFQFVLLDQLQSNFQQNKPAIFCLIGLIVLIAGSVGRGEFGIVIVSSATLLLHLFFGRFGSGGQWEPYVFGFLFTLAIGLIADGGEGKRDRPVFWVGAGIAALCGLPWIIACAKFAWSVPQDSTTIGSKSNVTAFHSVASQTNQTFVAIDSRFISKAICIECLNWNRGQKAGLASATQSFSTDTDPSMRNS